MKDLNRYWLNVARDQLLGRTITEVRYMNKEEMEGMDWSHRPVIMVLDDGNAIYPSADDEGNDGGSLFTSNEDNPVLPVLRDLK